VLNTIDFKKSLHYNPFVYIKNEKDILKFVTALIANTKGEDTKGGDDFWQKAEVLLYCALIGFIVYEAPEEEQNMNTLVDMINSMETHEEDESFKNAIDLMFDELTELDPQHFAVRQYAKYRLAAGKTAKAIM
jgi:type IV secretion system protein VirD4